MTLYRKYLVISVRKKVMLVKCNSDFHLFLKKKCWSQYHRCSVWFLELSSVVTVYPFKTFLNDQLFLCNHSIFIGNYLALLIVLHVIYVCGACWSTWNCMSIFPWVAHENKMCFSRICSALNKILHEWINKHFM